MIQKNKTGFHWYSNVILNQFFAWLEEWTGLSKSFVCYWAVGCFTGWLPWPHWRSSSSPWSQARTVQPQPLPPPAKQRLTGTPLRYYTVHARSTGQQENAYARHAKCSSLGLLRVSQQGTAEEFFPAVKLFVPLLHSLTRGKWCWVRTLPYYLILLGRFTSCNLKFCWLKIEIVVWKIEVHLKAVELRAGLAKVTEGGDFQLLLNEIIFWVQIT